MSDKSKLGFNINPKSYDELNSTDNLITSGSDSGWLGKKLQGDDSNDLDLSKINPIFDKELYEKYRPGVNTNDGSVNQDIWGYKCFNSPVSFRNGIYGDTYSIHSIDTYEGDQLNNTKKNGIIIQPYNKQAASLNNIDSTFRICNEKRSEQKDDKDLIYIDTRETHIQHSYTGKENQHNVEDVNLYDILKNTYIDGANTGNISYTQSNVFPGSGEYSIQLIQNTFDHCTIYSSNSTHRENAVTYNGINTFSNKKIDKQIGPFPYITTYNYKDFVNITSSIYYTNNIGTDEEPKHNYNISRITLGAECGNDPVIEKEITANNNCIRMYSADGTHGNSGYTNDNISSIITTPKTINLSSAGADNNYTSLFIITPDSLDVSLYNDGMHTKTFRHDGKYLIQTPYGQLYSQSTMSGPVTDIIYNFNDINDAQITNSNAFNFLIRSSTSDERQPIPDTVGSLRIGCNITYTGQGVDLNYKVIGTSITPLSLSTAAIQLNTVHIDDKFKDYNYVWPCAKIVPGSGTFGDGLDAIPTDDIKFVSLNQRDSSHIICDYLTVKNAFNINSFNTMHIKKDLIFDESTNGHNVVYNFNQTITSDDYGKRLTNKYYVDNGVSYIDNLFETYKNDTTEDSIKIQMKYHANKLFIYEGASNNVTVGNLVIGATDYDAYVDDKYRKPLMAVYSRLINTEYLMKPHRNSITYSAIYDPDLIGSASLYRRFFVVHPVVGDIYRICVIRGNTQANIISNITNIPTSTTEATDINRVFLPGTILFPYIPAPNATSIQELEAGYTYIITDDSRYTILRQNDAIHNNYDKIQYNKNNGGDCYLVLGNDKDLLYEVIEPVIFRGDTAFVYCTIKIVAKKYAEYTSSMV